MIISVRSQKSQLFRESAIVLIFCLLVGGIAISTQSLWIDEANTAMPVMERSLSGFVSRLENDKGSTMQMPLYMAGLWGWEKFFGSSEFALRSFNLPFFVLALLAITICIELSRIQKVFLVLFTCASPFLWAYLDEARPYILQFCGAVLAMIGLWNAAQPGHFQTPARLPIRDLLLFSAGILILCGSSLIGVIYSFFFGLAFFVAWLRRESIPAIFKRPDFWIVAVLSATLLAALGIYYFWTLQIGAKASGVGKTNLLSIGFAVYEFLGFSGLGPGRADLRENPVAALKGNLPFLAAFAAISGAFFLVGAKCLLKRSPQPNNENRGGVFPALLIVATALLCAGVVVLLGIFGQFRIVGRHFMPLFPFFLMLISILAVALWESEKKLQRGIVCLILLASLASALAFRFSPVHAKDDYRSAAAEAREVLDAGGVVWWAADPAGAEYYGLPKAKSNNQTESDTLRGSLFLVSNAERSYLEVLPDPKLVVLSKPDIYDASSQLKKWLLGCDFLKVSEAQSFTMWSPRP